ncbi:hypothetical protein [Streptomyces morookaense]|uniref:Uncharacterized protein n=1 Tax=Streptomyces morookaense TaxID=1970 RepID=A0A7Y7BBS8_STRMO|nr:hypothetical protein [Streptomyces morookaense]NVK82600.1 hypothetical protein [Streptomyces morookaense]GHF44997.1 hypothetical protein GCM10010359_54500 [Streptomyces morookaense]
MPHRYRTSAVSVLVLLLAVVFGPVLCGATGAPVPSTETRTGAQMTSATPAGSGNGSCRQQDVPIKGAEVAVAHGSADPLTAPGTARTPLPQARAPKATAPRAPPAPVTGCSELLPVLRI